MRSTLHGGLHIGPTMKYQSMITLYWFQMTYNAGYTDGYRYTV